MFQSALPRRERLSCLRSEKFLSEFQSTLPRRERLTFFTFLPLVVVISIHAPTKGATNQTLLTIIYISNFNPRSHEGSDIFQNLRFSSSILFQSTLPRRERHRLADMAVTLVKISIHAPTKGATKSYLLLHQLHLRFQSTLPRRERLITNCCVCGLYLFQSTLPRRERHFRHRT